MRKIIHFAIHQPLFVFLLTGLFIGAGVIAFRNLPVEASAGALGHLVTRTGGLRGTARVAGPGWRGPAAQ